MACGNKSIDVPHKREVPSGLRVGYAVRVQLYVQEDACSFHINLNADPCGETIALHFNPRQSEQTVVLNTKDGCWKEPETVPGCFQFQPGQYFEIVFIASDGCFDIYVNGSFYTSYKYRIAVEKVRYLEINGGIILLSVEINEPLQKDFTKKLPCNLRPGDIIRVKGFFYQSAKGFLINLLLGNCSKDIALAFNPRRDENTVVLNSQKNGCWGKEERLPLPCQLKQKTFFEVEISFTTCNVFKIYINGQWFANFTARGDVTDISSVQVKEDAYFYDVNLLTKVDKPFVDTLPLTIGSWVSVNGVVEKCASRFEINLQAGDSPNYGCDIVFHFNPRFTEGCTYRNSVLCGSWGVEEHSEPGFPFKKEERFEIIFLVLCGGYKVFVNGKYYLDYVHRVDPCRVNHVMLTGDADFFKP
ncbi:unnamed protein product [Candidula unifasciata]|uniref:Galectin n=1 Tax=Candidula unifasciata TaxID=100452 RepID=A0A8S3YF07_9EUPU|nr:unnamed protein product [Candidula unifasciata]